MGKKDKGQAADTETTAAEPAAVNGVLLTVGYPSKQKSFQFPKRYEEGHTLSLTEANALNGLLVENIRNNFSKPLEKLITEGKTDEEITAAFAQYAEEYEFAGKRASRAPVDPVQREAEKIASAKIDEALRKMGKSRKNLAEGVFDKHVQALIAQQPEIMEEAKRRVNTTQAIGIDSLSEILAGEVQEPAAAEAEATA